MTKVKGYIDAGTCNSIRYIIIVYIKELMSSEQSLNYCSYTVIKAFGGLVKFRAIDGNINNLAGM